MPIRTDSWLRSNISRGTSAGMRRWYMTTVPRCKACRKKYLITYKRRKIGYCASCEAVLSVNEWESRKIGLRLIPGPIRGWDCYTLSGDRGAHLTPYQVVKWVLDKEAGFVAIF